MIVNELKPLLGDGWKEKFKHRDLWDPDGYGVASFDLGDDREKVLAMNFATEDIMEYFFDDRPDDEWISLDRIFAFSKSKIIHHWFINKKLELSNDYDSTLRDLKKRNVTRGEYYQRAQLGSGENKLRISVHRLVSLVFVPNPYPDKYNIVNHKDLSHENFLKENLEWCDDKWNNQSANRKPAEIDRKLYLRIRDGKIFRLNELAEKYNLTVNGVRSGIKRSINGVNTTKDTYKGERWRIIDPILEDYLSRHPLQDDWYQHPTMPNVRANGCGVLEIDGKLRIGSRMYYGYYSICINDNVFRTHRLLFEAFSGKKLSEDVLIDHINPVTLDDCDNSINNLRKSNGKDNMNNPQTIMNMSKKVFVFDLFGNQIGEYASCKDAEKSLNISKILFSRIISNNKYLFEEVQNPENPKTNYIYYKISHNGNEFVIVDAAGRGVYGLTDAYFPSGRELKEFRKYINTGMPAPDGYYYQQGDPKNIIYDPNNKELIKKRPEIFWKDRKNREDD